MARKSKLVREAEEADFYRRNAGGPVAMTSMTRGRGFLGSFQPDKHLAAYYAYELGQRVQREQAEERRTYHHAHIDAFLVVWWAEWLRKQKAKKSAPRPRRRLGQEA